MLFRSKKKFIVFSVALLTVIMSGASKAQLKQIQAKQTQAEQPQAEILHWWSSAGEAAALDVFIDAFRARGGLYFDSTKNDQVASREEAIERMSKGYPATLTQWNAGRDVTEFFDFGLISAIDEASLVTKLKNTLPQSVINAVTYKGKIIAMPLNVHSENWMWFSKKNISFDNNMLAGNWQALMESGKRLEKKQIPLLAVGDQSWQVRILFTSVFLGVSRDTYKNFYLNSDPRSTASPEFRQTLKTFAELAKYSHSFGDGNWNTQVKAVADNNAGATFMGDWAKGEFKVLGKSLDSDYGCTLTSSNDPSLLLVIDTFILGNVQNEEEKQGQSLMLDLISDPLVNLEFNQAKGSISPYSTPAAEQLDNCSTQVYNVLSKDQHVLAPYASYSHGTYMHQIDNAIYQLWKDARQGGSTDTLVNQSIETFKTIIEKSHNTAIANVEE